MSHSHGSHDVGLETLLDLHGTTYRLDRGYWVKFEAYRVTPTDQIPHGISYCLTLHDRNNRRIIGFDNAHDINRPKGKSSVAGEQSGITNTIWSKYYHMNMSLLPN